MCIKTYAPRISFKPIQAQLEGRCTSKCTVHDRMPVILQPADYAAWLGAQAKAEDLKALLKPLPEDLMERYRVSRRMSNARNEGEECMAPWRGN